MTRNRVLYSLAASIALLTFLVYLPALLNDLIELDDAAYIRDNPHIRSVNSDLIRWAFSQFYAANWHPLTWLSHAIDFAFWGLNPVGHHLTNITLHAFNTALVVILAVQIISIVKLRGMPNTDASLINERTGLVVGGITGLLFGLHPLHVESVAWVAERKDLLCALFFLLTILQYGSYQRGCLDEKNYNIKNRRGFMNRNYLSALGFFILALLSKPMAVTLPCVLLLLDWYPYGRIRNIRTAGIMLIEKLPFVTLSMISSTLTIVAQRSGEALVSSQLVPLSVRLLVAVRSLLAYLWKMVFPHGLIPYYPYPDIHNISLNRVEYFIPVFLLVGITGACIVAINKKKQKMWLTAWSYYVITLLPVLGIVQVGGQEMADRYTYLPSLGPFLLVGIAGAWLFARSDARTEKTQTFNKFGIVAAVIAFLVLSVLTVRQIAIWKNSMVVFDTILARASRRSPVVYFHRGVANEKLGKLENAIEDYSRAISLFPMYYEAFFSRGSAYEKIGRLDRALEDDSEAILLKPSSYEAYTNRGLVNKKLGRQREALADFNQAVALSTSAGKAYLNIGIIRVEDGRFAEAIEEFSRAIVADPMDAEAYSNRAIVYAVVGQQGAALKDFDHAIELHPDFAVLYYNRGKLYVASGQREHAFADFQKACQLGDEISCQALRE